MRSRQEIEDYKHLKQFINLYKACKDVSKLKKVNNEESKVFQLKTVGAPIRFGSSRKLLHLLPQREGLYDFWRDNKYFWIIPMEVKPNEVYGFTIRGYEKEYNVFRLTSGLPVIYGLYDFDSDFKLHKSPIVLTEGIKDSLMIKTFYPYTLALNTAGLTANSINFVRGLTNRFILVYDNDKPGKEATERDTQSLIDLGCKVTSIDIRFKDVGKYIKYPDELELLNLNIQQYL